MISAVDSSVILDVLTDDPKFGRASESVLRRATGEGQLVVCECVLAEVFPALGSDENCSAFLQDWQLDFKPSSGESARLAGATFAAYLARGRSQRRIVADFLIAAHAQTHSDRLITRDRGFTRSYFKSLVVLDPSKDP
jgi:predicted nucleic acid-binding protein